MYDVIGDVKVNFNEKNIVQSYISSIEAEKAEHVALTYTFT